MVTAGLAENIERLRRFNDSMASASCRQGAQDRRQLVSSMGLPLPLPYCRCQITGSVVWYGILEFNVPLDTV